jgi:hypothetical protein
VYHQGKSWEITRVSASGDEVSIRPFGGMVAKADVPVSAISRTPPPAVTMQPVWPPAAPTQAVPTALKPTRPRKSKAPEVDPEKDQALVNAFADAIKQAAQQMGGGA